jgi:hypothetical protein
VSADFFPGFIYLRELVQLCFIKKKGQRRYKYLVLGRDRSYFVKKSKHSDSTKKFSETDFINMLEFLINRAGISIVSADFFPGFIYFKSRS